MRNHDMTSKQKRFNAQVNGLVKNVGKLEDAEVRKVIKMLDQARKEVAATVASTEWQVYYLPQMQKAIERAMHDFGTQYATQMRDIQRDFWAHGVELFDIPAQAIGLNVLLPALDVAQLSIMQGFSADLITGLERSAIEQINREISLGLMGQKTSYDVMQAVGRNLKDKSIFRSIAERADVITRTEANRVLSAATQARLTDAAAKIPGLMKEWKHSTYVKMPRQSHVSADGQKRPVDEMFDVGGEKLMYPRDPRGSASNTIKCHCYVVPYHPSWDEAVDKIAA